MRFFIGTSGYSYKEWKGGFYPANLPAKSMLSFYATKLRAVEINNTFYRMPTRKVVEQWGGEVPEGFHFALKAPRRITHEKRLNDVGADVSFLFDNASALGEKLGAVLFQLPPFLKKDVERLDAFLATLPSGVRAALETRHDSWVADDVIDKLRARCVAFCLSDTDEAPARLIPTARWGYLRMRRADYSERDLERWAALISEQPWDEVYVFFKHEDGGKGAELAGRLRRMVE